ncbi:hypothetical protein C8Q75DRAFT_862185 [Abortiporus biennis]|nr:hypothetical protein C8Q75DRAFT_862185 [Abortiporus biennis]
MNSSLSLRVSDSILHPEFSDVVLSEITTLYDHALRQPQAIFHSLPVFPTDILSSYERMPLELRKRLPYRIPLMERAADHLSVHAARQPDAIAVRWAPSLSRDIPASVTRFESMTYREWQSRANKLARTLIDRGLQPEDRVGVCMQRDLWYHVALLAVLRSGGCYVPIDPELPVERQLFIAHDAGAKFVITNGQLSDVFGRVALDIYDPVEQAIIEKTSDDDLLPVDLNGLAYLLYTSGTTGTPKGCLLTHLGLTEAIWALAETCAQPVIPDPSTANYLSIASVAFDVHLAEVFVPLSNGFPILSAPRSILLEDLPYFITEFRVSHVGIVPSLIEATMGTVQEAEKDGQGSTLRYLASGGEKMSDAILDKWADHPKVKLVNFYGPSEVTIGCACRFMNRSTPRANIGLTFPNVSSYVVDDKLNIVPRGVAGELVVEGPLVGRGYHGRPDLTKKVFLEFPSEGRWAYRTGDLVRMMPDSSLEILGRIDTQIKLRGVRIESEGISAIVRSAAPSDMALEAVTVLAKHPSIGIEQLVSFISFDASISISTRKSSSPALTDPPPGLLSAIHNACEEGLATYMRPSHVITLTWIPLNANGKTDAKALVQLFNALDIDTLTHAASDDQITEQPESSSPAPPEIVSKVLNVVSRFFKVADNAVSPAANLFSFGLDSMSAIRLASDLKAAFNVFLTPADILRDARIDAIAKRLHSQSSLVLNSSDYVHEFFSTWKDPILRAYSSLKIQDILPPFPVQEGMLFQSADTPSMYVQHVMMKCHADISIQKLQQAWREAMIQHDILRTVFFFGRELAQVVLDPLSVSLPWIEQPTEYSDGQKLWTDFLSGEALVLSSHLNSQISEHPPFQLTLFKSASNTHFLTLSIHHTLFDGISLPVLLSDVDKFYHDKPRVIKRAAHEILNYIHSIHLDRAREFWTQTFYGFPWRQSMLRSPTSREPFFSSKRFRMPLSTLQTQVSTQAASLQSILMGAYGYLLATRMYNDADVSFGVIRSGRMLPVEDMEHMVVPMLSVVPFRINLSNTSEIIRSIQDRMSAAAEFEHVPLSRVQQWVHPGEPLFETIFSLSLSDSERSDLWDLIGSENPLPEYILAVEVVIDPTADTLEVRSAYTKDLSSEVVDGIINSLEEVALQLCDNQAREALFATIPASRPPLMEESDVIDKSIIASSQDAPSSESFSKIREVVIDFFQVKPETITDRISLISLGLDSIRSVGLSRLFRQHDIRLSSLEIMKNSTLNGLAKLIERTRTQSSVPGTNNPQIAQLFQRECTNLSNSLVSEELKFSPDDRLTVLPTTVLQAGMLSQSVSTNGERYVHVFPLRIRKDLDVVELRRAWKEAFAFFPILRTSFHFLPDLGRWAQIAHSDVDFKWTEEASDPTTEAAKSWAHGVVSNLNWEGGECFKKPPAYLHLIRSSVSTNEPLLVLLMHHALYDGISIDILLRNVEDIYRGRFQKSSSPTFFDLLPQLIWQERLGISFWLRYLQGYSLTPLPLKHASDQSIAHLTTHRIDFEASVLEAARRQTSVTLQCFGQLAFAKLLASVVGASDIIYGHVGSGRQTAGSESVIGPVLVTTPTRTRLDPTLSNAAILSAMHRHNVDRLPWQHVSLRAIHQALKITQLWDSLFVYQTKQEAEPASEALWTFEVNEDDEETYTQYALNLELHEDDSGYIVKIAAAPTLVDQDELNALLHQFEAFLRRIVSKPDDGCCDDLPDLQTIVNSPPVHGISADSACDDSFDIPISESFHKLLSSITRIPVDHIHPSTSLAALGIDSITAIQVVGKARKLGYNLRAEEVVRSKTVGDLVKKLAPSAGAASVDVSSISISIPDSEETLIRGALTTATSTYPVGMITVASPGIQWLVGAWQRSEGNRFQHAFAFRLSADVSIPRLKKAWVSVLNHHSILRSTIASAKDSDKTRLVTFQFNEALVDLTWSEAPLTNPQTAEAEVTAVMKELVSVPASMTLPPTRVKAFSSSSSKYLVLYLHHFQYDAWSLRLLIDDISRSYLGEELGNQDDLSLWLKSCAASPKAKQEQRSYWTSVFNKLFKPTYFPSLRSTTPSEALTSSKKRIVYTNYTAIGDSSYVEEHSRKIGVTLQSIFLSAWAKVQAKHTSSDSATFGLWQSGRTAAVDGVERLVVPCMNVLPLNVLKAVELNVSELAHHVQEDLRNRSAVIDQTDLTELDEWIHGGGQPLCNVYVNIVKIAPDVSDESHELFKPLKIPYFIPEVLKPVDSVIGSVKVTDLIQDDIMIDIVNLPSGAVTMSIEASSHMMDERQAQELVDEWAKIVEGVL